MTVTVQLAERLRHPGMENRFGMDRMPAGSIVSCGLCGNCTDMAGACRGMMILVSSGQYMRHNFQIFMKT